jgi:hypothetical protein
MARSASSIANLGPGLFPGDAAILRYGGEQVELEWVAQASGGPAGGAWVQTEPHDAVEFGDLDPMRDGFVVPSTAWRYLFSPAFGTKAALTWGWSPKWLLRPDLARAAGLTLQESWDAAIMLANASDTYRLGLVSYSLNPPSDQISQLAIPIDSGAARNVGVQVVATGSTQLRFLRSGWVDTQLDTSIWKQVLAPHLYTKYDSGPQSGILITHAVARYRYVGFVP